MRKKTIEDVPVKGKRVLVRCDFNVPMDENKNITDDTRIRTALPTIQYLVDNEAKVILISHLGRPKGEPNKKYSLEPVAKRLAELLQKDVIFAADDDVVGTNAKRAVEEMKKAISFSLRMYDFEKKKRRMIRYLQKS